jgi:hypothetical protein
MALMDITQYQLITGGTVNITPVGDVILKVIQTSCGSASCAGGYYDSGLGQTLEVSSSGASSWGGSSAGLASDGFSGNWSYYITSDIPFSARGTTSAFGMLVTVIEVQN